MNRSVYKKILTLVIICLALSVIAIMSKAFSGNHPDLFLFGAIENFFKWWNELDPTVRFAILLVAAVTLGFLTGFAAASTGGLLFGVFTGFGNFCSLSCMLTSAFSKTPFGKQLKDKYGAKYDKYIMWTNCILNTFAFITSAFSVVNAVKAVDVILPLMITGLTAPDLCSQIISLFKAGRGDNSAIEDYLENHKNDDKNGLAVLLASAILLTPSSVLKLLQKSDTAQLENLVEETGTKLRDPDFYERIKSFFEIINNIQEKADDEEYNVLFNNIASAYKNIDLKKKIYVNDLYYSEVNFITGISISPFGQLDYTKNKNTSWGEINSLWQEKYSLFQHINKNMSNNSSYNNSGIFYQNESASIANNMRTTYALLELLNNIPKDIYHLNGYKILYNQYNHNLLVLKNNNIMDILNIEPQFLIYLEYQNNKDSIRPSYLVKKIESFRNNEISNVTKTKLLELIFQLAMLNGQEKEDCFKELKQIIGSADMQEIVKKALSASNIAFEDFLKSFSYDDNESQDYCFRQLTSDSNFIGLKRMDYYYFLETTFSKIYMDLTGIKDDSSDKLLKDFYRNMKTYKAIKDFKTSLDCKTLIAIPYYFR